MKSKLLLLLAACGLAAGASAQVTTPSSPAPAVTSEPASSGAPNRIIYSPRLPSPTELSNVAAAQGWSIERIDQTDSQITVIYRYSNGQTSTVSYQLLGSTSTPAATTTVVTAPPPTVIYREVSPYYYYRDPFYAPWGYYNPVSISLGFGYYGGRGYYGGHHGFHGGYRGHRRW
jgi:hypothetical protein